MKVIGKLVFSALFSYFVIEVGIRFKKLWDKQIGTAIHGRRYVGHCILYREQLS